MQPSCIEFPGPAFQNHPHPDSDASEKLTVITPATVELQLQCAIHDCPVSASWDQQRGIAYINPCPECSAESFDAGRDSVARWAKYAAK